MLRKRMRGLVIPSGASAELGKRCAAGSSRILLLMVVCVALGVGIGAVWFYGRNQESSPPPAEPTSALSDRTRSVLNRLEAPVEVRFYSVLGQTAVSLAPFAERVERLLAVYEQQASGKVKLTRITAPASESAKAAVADGIRAFNLEQGDECFLGIALVLDGKKESLPQLSPDWEPALESDITRSLIRLADASQAGRTPMADPQPDPAAREAVRRAFPNLAAISLEAGTRALRETALKELEAAKADLEERIQGARHRLAAAQTNGAEAEQQSALRVLQQLQAEQLDKLREIAARSQAEIEALRQLKREAPGAAGP